MKLLIIVICILSERYLIHSASGSRFGWFDNYSQAVSRFMPKNNFFNYPGVVLLSLILLPLIAVFVVLALLGNFLFGLIGFLINLFVFYYCLGPENPFYPVASQSTEDNAVAGDYFFKINNELFAVILWFLLLGPLGALAYRLISLCKTSAATMVLSYLDWISVRITLFLYLLVGNFPKAINFFIKMFFSLPENNAFVLSAGGLLAAHVDDNEPVTLPDAQHLVEHALVVYLVLVALFTLAAWL